MKFATTSIYHFLFVPLTIGLALLTAVLQTMWHRSERPAYLRLPSTEGGQAMAQYPMPSDQPVLNRSLLWAGAILIGAGALLGLAGSALCGTAAALALQRYVQASGMPPSELAMHHWRRAKTAARAGTDSWRGQGPRPASPTRVG